MKNIFLIVAVGLLTTTSIFAQDGFKDLKNAEKAIKKYITDNTKGDDLTQGLQLLDAAFKSDEVSGLAKSYLTKAKLLNSLANSEMKIKTLDLAGTYVIPVPNVATDAYSALIKANELAEKKNEKKEVQTLLGQVENHLNSFAIVAYQNKDFATAFTNFDKSIEAAGVLKSMGKASRLDDEATAGEQKLFAAISSFYSDNYEGAKPYLEELYASNSEEPFVYEALYNITSEANPDKAIEYLAKGRELAPDNTALLFAEINHYLKVGELDKLITKLETAIEQEPDNVSIYNTMGSVYDQLQQTEKDATKSAELRDKAKEYYEIALAKDPENFDAQYSIGALYYNKAATYVETINELSSDLTPAGMKKYDAAKAEMDDMFKQALPFFVKAEQLNGEDLNTIIALKEIYARINDLEKSNEYKTKYESFRAK